MARQKHRSENIQAWIEEIQSKSNQRQVLYTFVGRGVSTQMQIERKTKLTIKQVRSVLEEFVNGRPGFVPLIHAVAANMYGQRGRPQSLYTLTIEGAAVARTLWPEKSPIVPRLTNQIEISHTFMITELESYAIQANLNCEIESVFKIDERLSIRIDFVTTNSNSQKVFWEMEQIARSGNIPRIIQKVEHIARFFQSPQSKAINPIIRILFNIPANDKTTIRSWELALNEVQKQGKLPMNFVFMPILKFLDNPQYDKVDDFVQLEPITIESITSTLESEILDTEAHNFYKDESDVLRPPFASEFHAPDLSKINLILSAIALEEKDSMNSDMWAENIIPSFFDLIRTIYQVSHYKGGPVFENSELPRFSLTLLFRYLHMHQNSELLSLVINGREEVKRSTYRGINMFRDTYSRFCWNFMRYHGFGRSGPIDIQIHVPYLNSDESEVCVEVDIKNRNLVICSDGISLGDDLEITKKSLAWILNSFWIYGEELGLSGNKKIKNKPKLENMDRLFP